MVDMNSPNRFELGPLPVWCMAAVERYTWSQKLDQITSEDAMGFAAHRQAQKMQVSSVNSSLRVLRRLLKVAVEWGVLPGSPKVKLLRGERHRERVITTAEEMKYLAAAPEPLCSIATVLMDTGMRPEECFRLRWESITWANGRHAHCSSLMERPRLPAECFPWHHALEQS